MGAKISSDRKYQIFISSTFSDMEEERRVAVETILRTHNIPVGMEQFPSANRRSWDIIKEWIDESDIYLLIVGGRYGTVEPSTGKSFTHMEYEYAIQTQKPMIVCVIEEQHLDEKASRLKKKIVKEEDNPAKYYAFRDAVCKNQCSFYSNLDVLRLKISNDIHDAIMNNDLTGWAKKSKSKVHGFEESTKLFEICMMYTNHSRVLDTYRKVNSVKMEDELTSCYVEALSHLVCSCATGNDEDVLDFKIKMFSLFVKHYQLAIQHICNRLAEFESKSVYTDYRATEPRDTYDRKKREFKSQFLETETAALYPQNKAAALDNYNKVFVMGQELLKLAEEMEDDHLRGEHYERNDRDRMSQIGSIKKAKKK